MSAASSAIEGGCLCGAVRYRTKGPVGSVVHCHCHLCRKASGAPVVTWISVPRESFAFTDGEPELYLSSSHGERRFCGACGSQLSFQSTREPEWLDIALGTLDDPGAYRVTHHIWTTSRLPDLHLDEDLPDYPEGSPSGSRD